MKKFSELVDLDINQAVRDDHKIRQVIARIMPPDSVVHLQFCRIENRILKLTLDNASWLARLRFISTQLVDELAAEGITVADVTWHVAPEKIHVEPRPRVLRDRARSEKSAKILASTANGMEDDDLKRALLKVAEQLAKRSDG